MNIETTLVESEIRSYEETAGDAARRNRHQLSTHAEADPLELRLLLKWKNVDFRPIELRFATMRAK